MNRNIIGKRSKPNGVTPAIGLINPKYAHNVGAAVRAASCFGINQVWYTGNRVSCEAEKGQRLPREERMKGYKDVDLIQFDYIFDQFDNCTPIAIEVSPNAEQLPDFEHPENPLYIFGPEDGSIPQVTRKHCHRFVIIPTRHCTNLAAAVYLVLYDRQLKRHLNGIERLPATAEVLDEPRGWLELEERMVI